MQDSTFSPGGRCRGAVLIAAGFVALSVLFSYTAPSWAVEVPSTAYAEGAVDDGNPRVEARLLVDVESVAPDEPFLVGVLFDMDEHWHIYWKDSGEAGIPTKIEYRSDGAQFGRLEWPPHETFLDPSGMIETLGYADQVLLWARATTTTDGSEVEISAKVNYLACDVECIPGEHLLERTVPVGEFSPPAADVAKAFATFAGEHHERAVTLSSEGGGATTSKGGEDDGAPLELWYALLLAFLGGMLLNLMPCVFPVLAVKVFSLVKLAHEDRGKIVQHGAAYTGGIVATMLALAAVVVGLKWAGTKVGWGFQFQEPAFLFALSAVFVLFALNLFGVFDVNFGSGALQPNTHAEGLRGSFGKGVLAVVAATPCSAPFLGTAVGYALTASSLTIFLIFAMLGVGLAIPFVILTLAPGWMKVLPKPGNWMLVFKQLLGFVLLATVVWLVWVLGQSLGVDVVARALVFVVAVSMAAWMWGKVQYGARRRRIIVGGLALLLVAGTGFWAAQFEDPSDSGTATSRGGAHSESDGMWRPFTEEAVAEELAAGHVVFVDFTADWCITCKVNERTVLSTSKVLDEFARDDVTIFKADWTQEDERIRRVLERHGKGGVPMYLVYSPEKPDDPRVLPEVITPDLVVGALRDAR